MSLRGVRRARAGVVALALLPAFALAGCSTTIDNGKAESLIRQSVSQAGNFKVKSVSCPSGVTAKAGGTFTCKLTVTSASGGSEHSGTVTIHMEDSKGHVSIGSSDYHIQ